MRALILPALGEPEDLVLKELPDPAAGPGEALVHMRAAAVNFPDLLTIRGQYQVRPALPFIPGKEGAGVIAALGQGVTGLQTGDRVMVQMEIGAFAEKLVVAADDCFPIPDEMGFDEAASVGIAYQTAHFALVERAAVKPGEIVLVTAATGSVGLAALQLAKALGCTVFAGLTTPAKADIARGNGADHVIDLSRDDPRASVRDQIHALTDGAGVDVVIESVGGAVFDGALRSLAWCGRLVVVGFTGGTIANIKSNYLLLKNISVTGVNWANYLDRHPEQVRRVQDEIFRMYRDGTVRVPVQARFAMEDVVQAFDIIRGRRVQGKLVITMGQDL
jgi:NADPH2:quinone reductase